MERIVAQYETHRGELVTISHYGGHDALYMMEYEHGGKFELMSAEDVIQHLARQLRDR